MKKIRYALCGISSRAIYHFLRPLLGKAEGKGSNDFSKNSEVVGLLDVDARRVALLNEKLKTSIPFYPADQFDRMLRESRPDTVLVAGPDWTHARYIVGALKNGLEAIAEKPMVINCEQVREVWAAEKKTGKKARVAFNYRYAPGPTRIKEMILAGKLGRITNVEFIYNLDTFHGASYFYRWNRVREKSGGLSIHKCCHHFDLVNWFLDDWPERVFAFGKLNYYGPKGAHRPKGKKGEKLSLTEEKRRCPYFKRHYSKVDPSLPRVSPGWDAWSLPYNVQYPDSKPAYIYDKEINIEDTYSMVARYRSGVSLSYSCNFSTPWEGYILGMNGTEGRVEMTHHSNPDPTGLTASAEKESIVFYPLFGGKEMIDVPLVEGGHGGADGVIQRDLFLKVSEKSRKLGLVAGSQAGAYAVAMGEAVWRSIKEDRPIQIEKLLKGMR